MLKDSILAEKVSRSIRVNERDGESVVESFWSELQSAIQNSAWDFSKLAVYQDALPVGPDDSGQLESKIVADLSTKGNPNYVILHWLQSQGASLVGTEDPQLLLEEYQLVKQSLADDSRQVNGKPADTTKLLKRRDNFIAERINSTLPQNHTGIIFLGMLHHIEAELADDVEIQYPFGKPSTDSVAVINNY